MASFNLFSLYFAVHDGNWHNFQPEHEMAKWWWNTFHYKLTQFWIFNPIFMQLRINLISIYLEWQVLTSSVCTLQYMMGIDTIFGQNMKMAMKWKHSVYTLQYMMGIDAIFRQNMKMAMKWNEILTEDRYRTARARGQKFQTVLPDFSFKNYAGIPVSEEARGFIYKRSILSPIWSYILDEAKN